MPPTAETDPAQRTANAQPNIGLRARTKLMIGSALGSAALLVSSGNALASNNSSADVEKAALAAFGKNAITRSVDSFPSPASVATNQAVEAPAVASASSGETTAGDTTGLTGLALKKFCIKKGLIMPKIEHSVTFKNPKRNAQLISAHLTNPPLSPECRGTFSVLGWGRFQIQDKDKGYRWTVMRPGQWSTIRSAVSLNDEGGRIRLNEVATGHENDAYFHQAREKISLQLRSHLVRLSNNKVIAKRTVLRRGIKQFQN